MSGMALQFICSPAVEAQKEYEVSYIFMKKADVSNPRNRLTENLIRFFYHERMEMNLRKGAMRGKDVPY